MEYFVHLRLQGHPDHRLRHPVNDIGNTENPYASLLRYFHRADRTVSIQGWGLTCDDAGSLGEPRLAMARSAPVTNGYPLNGHILTSSQ